MKKARWPGEWKFSCHVCGFQYPSGEIRKRWDGLMVCQKDWETKHPQLYLRVRKEDAIPAYVSQDIDDFIVVCDINTSSGYAGMGTAGCMQAGNDNVPYLILLDLYTNGHGSSTTSGIISTERGPRIASLTPSGPITAVTNQVIRGLVFSGVGLQVTIPAGVTGVIIEDCQFTGTTNYCVYNQGVNTLIQHCRFIDSYAGILTAAPGYNVRIRKSIFDDINLGPALDNHAINTIFSIGPTYIDDNYFVGTNIQGDVVSNYETSEVTLINNNFVVEIVEPSSAAFTIGDGVGTSRGRDNYIANNTVQQTGGVAAGVFGSEGNTLMEFNCLNNGIQAYDYNSGPFVGVTIQKNVFPLADSFYPLNLSYYGGATVWATNVDSTDCTLLPTV